MSYGSVGVGVRVVVGVGEIKQLPSDVQTVKRFDSVDVKVPRTHPTPPPVDVVQVLSCCL